MMFSPQAEAKGLALDFAAEGEIPAHVSLDPDRLRQVLLNLIGNAVKFTDAGRVRLVLRYEKEDQALHIAVEDTGAGLTDEQQARLFQRFSQVDGSSTRRHGGTGQGLAICKGLVEAMGGQIGVRGRPGDGATFFLHILAPLAEKQAADQLLDLSHLSLEGVRVLVVDDNPINRELARAVLEAVGAEVTEAIDGRGGLHAAMSQPFDAILLDIRMPDLDGPETLRLIRCEPGPNRSIPIIAFTADADVASLSSEDGFDDLVRKPVDPVKLIQTLANWCHWDWSMSGGVEDANAA